MHRFPQRRIRHRCALRRDLRLALSRWKCDVERGIDDDGLCEAFDGDDNDVLGGDVGQRRGKKGQSCCCGSACGDERPTSTNVHGGPCLWMVLAVAHPCTVRASRKEQVRAHGGFRISPSEKMKAHRRADS